MNYGKLSCLLLLVSICGLVSARGRHRPGRSKDGPHAKKAPKSSLKSIETCMGEPIEFKDQIDAAKVEECLEMKLSEFQEMKQDENLEGNETKKGKKEKRERKKEKRQEKLSKKLKKKCMPECEWRSLNLVPDVNVTENYPPQTIPDSFLKVFPEQAKEKIKARMESCYNMTTRVSPKAKKLPMRKMCFSNVRLLKCFARSIRQTCNGQDSSTISIAPASGNVTGATAAVVSDETTSPASDEDDDEAEDDKDDDDENEIDNVDTSTVSAKEKDSTPGTLVSTTKPITK